jgi:hypothetical protein
MAEQREEGDQDDREACGGFGASVPSRADRALDEDGQKRKDESQAQQTESKESWLGPNPYRRCVDAYVKDCALHALHPSYTHYSSCVSALSAA